MSWTPIVFYVALSASVILNVFLTWYSVKMIKELVEISSVIEELFIDIDVFSKHLGGVHELEMFYGDQTLGNLLLHARSLTEGFEKHKVLFSLSDSMEDDEDEQFTPENAA